MWCLLYWSCCFTVITAWHHPQRLMVPITRLFADNNNDGLIDPFDGIKDTPKRSTTRKISKKDRTARDSTEPMSPSSTQQQTPVPVKPAPAEILTVEERLMNRQAKMLQSLPADVFFDFRNVVEQLLPRIAVITCTVYVMMLIPILWYIKRTTGESIIPYLYIGPLLYLVPYGTFWTWENDVVPVRYVDERLEDLLNKFQKQAILRLTEEREQLLATAAGETYIDEKTAASQSNDRQRQSNDRQRQSNEQQRQSNDQQAQSNDDGSEEAIDRLARLTLLSQLDIANFVPEVIAIKKRVKGADAGRFYNNYNSNNYDDSNNNGENETMDFTDSTGNSVGDSIEDRVEGSRSLSSQRSNKSDTAASAAASASSSANAKRRGDEGGILGAAKAVVEAALLDTNDTNEQLLDKLKQLERDLNEVGKEKKQ